MPEKLSHEQIAKVIVSSFEKYSIKKMSEFSGASKVSCWKYRKIFTGF
jgi:hypothetical protein